MNALERLLLAVECNRHSREVVVGRLIGLLQEPSNGQGIRCRLSSSEANVHLQVVQITLSPPTSALWMQCSSCIDGGLAMNGWSVWRSTGASV